MPSNPEIASPCTCALAPRPHRSVTNINNSAFPVLSARALESSAENKRLFACPQGPVLPTRRLHRSGCSNRRVNELEGSWRPLRFGRGGSTLSFGWKGRRERLPKEGGLYTRYEFACDCAPAAAVHSVDFSPDMSSSLSNPTSCWILLLMLSQQPLATTTCVLDCSTRAQTLTGKSPLELRPKNCEATQI